MQSHVLNDGYFECQSRFPCGDGNLGGCLEGDKQTCEQDLAAKGFQLLQDLSNFICLGINFPGEKKTFDAIGVDDAYLNVGFFKKPGRRINWFSFSEGSSY